MRDGECRYCSDAYEVALQADHDRCLPVSAIKYAAECSGIGKHAAALKISSWVRGTNGSDRGRGIVESVDDRLARGNGVRLSRDITGWAFMVEVDGVRHAGLAVGLADISPFTAGDGAGGSLFTRANSWWGLPVLLSLNELPFGHPVDHRWCVTQDDGGVLSVFSPDGAYFVHDLRLEEPPGWRERAIASGSVMLVVSHVLPAMDDPIGALDFETRQGMVCLRPRALRGTGLRIA